MNIDFIKWMCEKAEGFECFPNFSYLSVDSPEGFRYSIPEIKNHKILYPLLLQRAIEGVNRRTKGLMIAQDQYIGIYDNWGESIDDFEPVISSDQAKESALKYIYEQEKK